MSSVIKSMKYNYSNDEISPESIDVSDDDDFNFKYVPSNQFKYIVKDVRRQRTKNDEERVWTSFVNRQDQKPNYYQECYHGVDAKQLLRENLQEVDEELRKFDAYSEQTERLTVCTSDYKRSDLPSREEKKSLKFDYQVENDDDNDSESSSTLRAVQKEDEDELIYERSPVSQLDFKSKTTKLRYEHTIRHHHERPCTFYRDCNCRDCTSTPELISQNGSNQYSSHVVRIDPVVAHKILGVQTKISELLDEISYRLCRIPQPDGDIDLKRRQQRVMEFAVRFSRNYLYELRRQMSDVQRHVRVMSPSAKRPTKRVLSLHMQALEQKLCSIHQLLLNALSAYCKHIPSSILKGHPGKLKEILQVVIDLRDVSSKINLTAELFGAGDTAPLPLGKDTQKRCYAILSKLRLTSDHESVYNHTAPTMIGTSASEAKRRNRLDNRKHNQNRFSMYCVDSKYSKCLRNRRPVTVGVCPRTTVGRLRLNNPASGPIEPPHPNIGMQKPRREVLKRNRARTRAYQKEDDIRTVMEMMPTDSEIGSNGMLSHICHSSMANANKIPKKNAKRQSDTHTKSSKHNVNCKKSTEIVIKNKQLSSLIPIITDLISLAAKKQKNSSLKDATTMEALLEFLHEYLTEKMKSSRKSSITSESLESASKSSETQRTSKTQSSREFESNREFVNSALSNDKKSGLTQLKVPQDSADRLLKYRDEYQRLCSLSPMYTSNSLNKPWDVVSWISDKLIDELIVEISKELQMDDLIKKLVDLEFQDF
ncbi:uncharacterized protein LOC123260216 isoform X1 [Cotesia glomerata]|uniref:Uncharacterized protein n=1 Tax=Cotesia glomerata TaxID=32391 RepID=A0AAV7JAJ8_COTGL|nr:uncharacterized protein LOC123260216 isoform X1 [Cotesia glomerata]XP_044577182.1 uncharacterized protein LOC123260216 isoform X1 [Cotesia glomerata]KAH0569124.1 hypothetical protein KQX54_021832 [Cotesia glomerata]